MKVFYVYIMTSEKNGTLYIGVTSDLIKRIWEHKDKVVDGFTQKYGIDKLVYYETHATAEDAFKRESQLKNWKRYWKIKLIEEKNPDWKDLYESLI